MQRILIVEDDSAIAEIEKDYLVLNGYAVTIAEDGYKGLSEALSGHYDLILLDVMLPGIDGFAVCRELRKKLDIPILMVTARFEDADQIKGLGLGANDYITKPFSPGVLVARVQNSLLWYAQLKGVPKKDRIIRIGEIELHTEGVKLRKNGKDIDLKRKEYELLLFFMLNPGIVFTRDELYERVWEMGAYGDSSTVTVHINRVREKIENDPANPEYILTVRGYGYRFREL